MKCKNCGANYKTRELKCPYCGTENLVGKIWMKERSQAELEYEQAYQEMSRLRSPYVANRVLNRALLIIAGLFVLTFAGAVAFFFGHEAWLKLYKAANRQEILQTMQACYENGELAELYVYMKQYDLIGEDQYAYSQAALLGYDYNSYINHKLQFLSMTDEEKAEDDYHLEYSIRNSLDVYTLDQGLYSELDPFNLELLQAWQTEILSYWTGTLGMSQEEVAQITDAGYYFSYRDMDTLVASLKERRAWHEN